jgi:hypothetical protein
MFRLFLLYKDNTELHSFKKKEKMMFAMQIFWNMVFVNKLLLHILTIFCQDFTRVIVVCYEKGAGGGGGGFGETSRSPLLRIPVFENDPKSDLIQNKLRDASLGTD